MRTGSRPRASFQGWPVRDYGAGRVGPRRPKKQWPGGQRPTSGADRIDFAAQSSRGYTPPRATTKCLAGGFGKYLLHNIGRRFIIAPMDKPKIPDDILEFFRQTGAQGGKARAKKHSKEQLSEWGRKGGRPKGSGKQKAAKKG